ncbi:hypothetical protein X471_00744 [Bartonella bacilliformis str. Heidi Mejia]|nr:hypothetical protein X471_00744 [Bartonella bacilliformis str. Heidi Mejia]
MSSIYDWSLQAPENANGMRLLTGQKANHQVQSMTVPVQ